MAYGPRALPVQVSLDTLVTRGYTAVGNVLTEGELVETRGTEILAHDGDLFLTLARNAAGAALYVFVTEGVGEGVRRYDRVQAEGCVYGDVAVRDEFIVVVLWRVKERFLGGLFARGGVEDVDLSYGTRVIVYQQGGGILSDAVVPGVIMTNVTDVSESEGKFRVSGIAVAEECSLADIWMSRVSPLQRQGLVEIVDAEVEWVDESVVAPVSGCLRSLYMQSDDGRAGIARLENGRRDVWYAGAVTLSGACVSPCGGYVSAIETSGAGGRFVVLDAGDLEGGVVSEVGLGEFGEVGVSAGGVWEDVECEWSEEGSRVVKSAYELFDEKNWNDIESGFSSLGLG